MSTEYQIFQYNLAAAGNDRVWLDTGFISFLEALDAAGVEAPLTRIEIALGEAVDDWIPFTPGSVLRIQKAEKSYMFKVRWPATAGVTIKLLWGSNANDLDLIVQRATQLVVGNMASSVAADTVTVGTSSTLICAANANRTALTIQNDGTADVFIGPSPATTDMLKLAPGASYTTTTATAAIYGISGSAGHAVRYLEEG